MQRAGGCVVLPYLRIHLGRVVDRTIEDLLVGRKVVLRLERRMAVEHLEEKDTESPIIDCFAVALFKNQLWREVFRGATQSPRSILDVLGETEISELERPILHSTRWGEERSQKKNLKIDARGWTWASV